MEEKRTKTSYQEPLMLIGFVIIGAALGLVLGERASMLVTRVLYGRNWYKKSEQKEEEKV